MSGDDEEINRKSRKALDENLLPVMSMARSRLNPDQTRANKNINRQKRQEM